MVLSNDAGSTWNDLNPGDFRYHDCSMSADGQTIALAPQGQELMVSADSGATFRESTSGTGRTWVSILVCSDGSKILAGTSTYSSENEGSISFDAGTTWTRPTAVSKWTGMAMSEDGSKIYVLADQTCSFGTRCGNPTTTIWSSFDSGSTWQEELSERGEWTDLATTSDGSIVLGIKAGTPW